MYHKHLSRSLKSLGITPKIELPGVGENLIEQPSNLIAFSGDLEPSASAYHAFVTMHDIFGNQTAKIAVSTKQSLQKWARQTVNISNGALTESAVLKQLQIQHDLLFQQNVTAAEIITVIAPEGLLASAYWILLPFSRGSVHLGAVDKINEPIINPRLLSVDFDLTAQIATGNMAQRFWLSQPMATARGVGGPLVPGPDILPENATGAQWEAFTRDTG